MKKLAFAGLAVGMLVAAPAQALEHEVVIDHPAGPIAADYTGTVNVETRQVGTAGVAGRPSTLRCTWTASLRVERTAVVGDTMQSRRSMTSEDVATGSKPGWCSTRNASIDRLVDARKDTFRTTMLALVEQDRTAILAEADSIPASNREG
jgi:hypothetical protein